MSTNESPFVNSEKIFEISKIYYLHSHLSKYQIKNKELLFCIIKCETVHDGTVIMQGTMTKLEYQVIIIKRIITSFC